MVINEDRPVLLYRKLAISKYRQRDYIVTIAKFMRYQLGP